MMSWLILSRWFKVLVDKLKWLIIEFIGIMLELIVYWLCFNYLR